MNLRRLITTSIIAMALGSVIPFALSKATAQADKKQAKAEPKAESKAEEKGAPTKGSDDSKSESKPEAKPNKQKSYFEWFYEAEGVFFFPQLFISIAVIALIIQNAIAVLKPKFWNDSFVRQFESQVKNRQLKEAFESAKNEKNILGKVLVAGLSKISDGYSEADSAMQEAGDDESMKYEHRLSYLSMIGNIATMVGLLGTVYGMVGSFIVISNSDTTPKPAELATGVSQALVTTILGLIQAIPAIISFTIFKNLVARRLFDLSSIVDNLMRPFKSMNFSRKGSASETNAG